MKQTRRKFLLATSTAGALTLAGCVSDSEDDDETEPDENGGDGRGAGGTDECEDIDLAPSDHPPHDPERPPSPDGLDEEDEWDDHYLGAGMDDTTALAFDRVNVRYQDEPALDQTAYNGSAAFHADLVTAADEFDEQFEAVEDESAARIDDIDWEQEALVVVQSGFGSSSVRHEWVRIDENCGELHIHGYYVQPYIQTSDYTSRTSGIVVERPADYELEGTWVSLTIAEETRANFPADADVHVVGDEDKSDEGGEVDDVYPGPIEAVDVVDAHRPAPGGWYSSQTDELGAVVELTSVDELESLLGDGESTQRFLELTDFDEDAVYYIESVGPNACHRTIDVDGFVAIANGGYTLEGEATVSDDGASEYCADVITFPGALVRVEADVDFDAATFTITNGWDEEGQVDAISMSEFAQE